MYKTTIFLKNKRKLIVESETEKTFFDIYNQLQESSVILLGDLAIVSSEISHFFIEKTK